MLRPRVHIFLMAALLAAAVTASFVIMRQTDPQKTSWEGLTLIYGLMFLAVFSLTTILGYLLRIAFWRSGVKFEFLRAARRQGAIFGFLAGTLVFLQSREILSVWTGALLILGFALAEFYFLAH